MVWSFVFLLIINIFMRTWSRVRDALADPRTRLLLPVAAALVSVNWGTYIWAVNNGYVVESSLGYFINPLVSVALGVFVLGETLRRPQMDRRGDRRRGGRRAHPLLRSAALDRTDPRVQFRHLRLGA